MSDYFEGEKRLTNFERYLLRERQNHMCYLCGNAIYDCSGEYRPSIDHVIPKAVAKWGFELSEEEYEDLKRILNDDRNTLVAHRYCNKNKGTKLLTSETVDTLYLSADLKKGIKDLLKEAEPYVTKYKNMFHDIASKNKFQCKFCTLPCTVNNSAIRRIDTNQSRSRENACVVHQECCDKFSTWGRQFHLW